MRAELKQNGKGKELVVSIPLDEKGYVSETGKTHVHATSHGNVECGIMMPNGRTLLVGLTAYTRIPKGEK